MTPLFPWLHFVLSQKDLTKLIFTDIHELFGRTQFGGGTSFDIRLHFPTCMTTWGQNFFKNETMSEGKSSIKKEGDGTFERLEGGVVEKLGLLNHMKVVLHPIVGRFGGIAPVEKVVVVDYPSAEIRL